MAKPTVTVASYLVKRLEQVAEVAYCLSGDYLHGFFNQLEKSQTLTRVYSACEQEGGYAAWGFSMSSPPGKVGVVATTHGVGTINALNATTGGWVENCPMIVIDGSPSTMQRQRLNGLQVVSHHQMLHGERVQLQTFEPVTSASMIITNEYLAAAQIDLAIRTALLESRPVYLEVLQDMWAKVIPEDPTIPLAPASKYVDLSMVTATVEQIMGVINARPKEGKKKTLIWAGHEIRRFGAQQAFQAFIEQTGVEYVTDCMGKGVLDETQFAKQYLGVLDGKVASQRVLDALPNFDLVLQIGLLSTDLTILGTNLNTIVSDQANWFIINSHYVTGPNRFFASEVGINELLAGLSSALGANKHVINPAGCTRENDCHVSPAHSLLLPPPADPMTYDIFVSTLKTAFSHRIADTTFVGDATLATLAMANEIVVKQNGWYSELGWGSIGFTSGGSIGIKHAVKAHPNERVVTVIGDGGLQNCPTGLSTMARLGMNNIVFVMVNKIYAIDQWLVDLTTTGGAKKLPIIDGETPEDNRLPHWNFVTLAQAFNAQAWDAHNVDELNKAITEALANTKTLSVIAVHLPDKGSGVIPRNCYIGTFIPAVAAVSAAAASAHAPAYGLEQLHPRQAQQIMSPVSFL